MISCSPRASYDTSCVIVDVQMPGMSGVELQSLLIAKGNRTPMIFITAFPDERTRARVLERGAICFLSKPCDGPTLIRCLDKALTAPPRTRTEGALPRRAAAPQSSHRIATSALPERVRSQSAAASSHTATYLSMRGANQCDIGDQPT